MRLLFLRHGMTKGNQERRYIGVTDEPLSEEGREMLRQQIWNCCRRFWEKEQASTSTTVPTVSAGQR